MKKIITLIILLFIASCGNISDKEYLKKLIEYRKQLAAREITQEEYTVLKNKMINKVVAGEEIGTLFLAHKRPDFDFKKYLTERPYFKA